MTWTHNRSQNVPRNNLIPSSPSISPIDSEWPLPIDLRGFAAGKNEDKMDAIGISGLLVLDEEPHGVEEQSHQHVRPVRHQQRQELVRDHGPECGLSFYGLS